MNTYVFFIRVAKKGIEDISEKEKSARNKKWVNWVSHLAKMGKLAEGGNHLATDGKVVESNGIVREGPYIQNHSCLLGYILVHAVSFDEAIKLTRGCPVLDGEDTTIEVREISAL